MGKKIKTIGDLTPDPHNANKGNDRGRKAVLDSLSKYGAGRSIVTDRNGVVIGGNKTLEGASAAGIDVEVVKTNGDKLVVVQREDLDLLEDAKARQLAYADNRAGELGLDWDAGQIAEDIESGLDLGDMFSEADLKNIGVAMPEPEEPPEAQMDAAEQLQEKWQVKDGDIWQIGEHRLMCGSSISAEDVASAISGNEPSIMVTDPPYGVKLDASWRDGALKHQSLGQGNANIIQGDDIADWREAYSIFSGNIVYIWHASGFTDVIMESIRASGFEPCQQIIWNKSVMVMSRTDYHYKHECCWYAIRKGKNHGWIGDRKQTTVMDIASPNHIMGGSKEEHTAHPTQKPVECMAGLIKNHAGDVYDPFLGSGTTMVAAEQLGRKCYGMEIEPKYCAVILERMSDMGLEPELIENVR